MKKFFFIIICLSFFCSCKTTQSGKSSKIEEINGLDVSISKNEIVEDVSIDSLSFSQIWTYLIDGNEKYLDYDFPLTDIGYFGAEVNSYGELINIPKSKKIEKFKGRLHLVVTCNSTSLTHFILEKEGNVREPLIKSLVEATQDFDGLQIDFEYVPKRDKDTFFSFLQELRQQLPDKIFSVALPARTNVIENDVYDYERISSIVDYIFVMAYDEHWSTSAPGAIASIDWCERIAKHSKSVIPKEKLIMGLPFYGRTWGNVSLNRAYFFSGIQRILAEHNVSEIKRINGIPSFEYEISNVKVTGFYDDVYSLMERLNLYKNLNIDFVGFWCLGQEDSRIWNFIQSSE